MSATLDPDALVVAKPNVPEFVPRRSISPLQATFLIALPVLALVYVYLASKSVLAANKYERAVPTIHPSEVNSEPDGPRLFQQHCARCHGERGNADGVASPHLDPWARKFGEERFQLATTTNGMPSDDDLRFVIHHGIPGTGMPSFETLGDDEKAALVRHVRILTYAGMYKRIYERDVKDDDVNVPRAIGVVEKAVKPGTPYPVPSDLPGADAESLVRGRKIFLANCATCHGPNGAGDGPNVKGMKNDNGQPTFPRDLARGVFKGGGENHRLFLRLSLGMPGTPMPAATTLKPSEVGDVVNFVKSLKRSQGEQ